jgi:hypothetical protein
LVPQRGHFGTFAVVSSSEPQLAHFGVTERSSDVLMLSESS